MATKFLTADGLDFILADGATFMVASDQASPPLDQYLELKKVFLRLSNGKVARVYIRNQKTTGIYVGVLNSEFLSNTTSVLGQAILGQMILGNGGDL